MRSFTISILIIAGICLLIFFDVVYVTHTIDNLTRSVHVTASVEEFEQLETNEMLSKMSEVEALWRKHRPLILLAVNRQYIVTVDTLLANMRETIRAEDVNNYAVSRSSLLIALHNIRQIEGFTLEGIV